MGTARNAKDRALSSLKEYDVVIVGAGQAGGQAAHALRAGKFDGSIALVGAEAHAPYERPPLSKDYLLGEKSRDRLYLRADTYWADKDVAMHLGSPVTEVDPVGHRVTTASGSVISYKKLIWAAGGDPCPLPVKDVPPSRVHVIRTLDDIDRLNDALTTASCVHIVGAGYIGLEAAAVLRKLGKDVSVIELSDRVLSRVSAPAMSAFFQRLHENNRVTFRLGTVIDTAAENSEGRLALLLSDGTTEICDLLIVGIGIIPSIAALESAGAEIDRGIVVNEFCRSTLEDIYAIGDCAAFHSSFAGGARVRVESVQNANDQAKTVALDILGRGKPYAAFPWFWSDQYDIKLQTIGLNVGYDETITRGDPDTNSFSLIYLRDGMVCAIDAINRPLDFAQGRMLLGKPVDKDDPRVADIDVPFKDLLTS